MIQFGDMGPSPYGPVFDAWSRGDLDEMLSVAHIKKCRLIDRHYLLLGIVEQTYKRAVTDPKRATAAIGGTHIADVEQIAHGALDA